MLWKTRNNISYCLGKWTGFVERALCGVRVLSAGERGIVGGGERCNNTVPGQK